MSSSKLTSILFASLLDSPAVVELASPDGEKAFDIIKERFTFSAHEITHAYQNSYRHAFTAVCLGIAMPENFASADSEIITREFSEQIEQNYLQPFFTQQGVPSLEEFRQQVIETLEQFAKNTETLVEIKEISEQDLAALINYREPLAITDIALEQMQPLVPVVHDTLAAFLRYEELLGNAILFFFREQLRKDDQQRLQKTQTALQQKGFCVEMQRLHSAIQTAQQNLNRAIAEQTGNIVELAQKIQQLQKTQLTWETSHQSLIRLAPCFGNRTAEILAWAKNVYSSLNQIDPAPEESNETIKRFQEPVIQANDVVLENLQNINQLMAQLGLSSQISPRDELVQFDSDNRQLIHDLVQQLTQLPTQHPQYSQLTIQIGRVLSSIGDLAQAEPLFLTAIEKAHKQSDKALAYYNLFQIRWRKAYSATSEAAKEPIYADALTALQAAIEHSNGRYALHDINKGYYPIEKILGVGGMGCVLLCQNHNYLLKKHPLVVVKCFWENVTDRLEKVFKESFIMHEIASDIVPEPLDFGYADNLNKQNPYFLTEYIEDAIDGEAWLEKYGPLSLETGLQVALQIAEGLQRAHNKGIDHLDLKPANLLLLKASAPINRTISPTESLHHSKEADSNGDISVKIIDFGLASVTSSLRQAVERRSRSGLMVFGQTVFGTLDYAPPEQQGFTQYGKPSAKSDLFSFGATMYRLWTGNSPRHFRERELPNVPALRDLLFDCVADNPQKRPQSTTQLIESLKAIEASLTPDRANESEKEITPQSNEYEGQIDQTKNRNFQPAESRNQVFSTVSQPAIEPAKPKTEQEQEQEQDDQAWQSARQKNTIAAYQAYLDGPTDHKHADEAKQRLTQKHQHAQQQAKQEQDDQAWQTARQKNTIAAYQAYLDGSTDHKHADEAKQRLTQQHQQAQQQAKQEQDDQAWQSARQKNTIAAYQAYLDSPTDHKHADEAKQRLTQQHQHAQQQAKQEQDDQAWQSARQKNTIAAYKAYLDGPTDHKHADEAKQRLTQLHQQAQKQAQQEEQDNQAWQTANQKNTIAAYQAYLDGPTDHKHADEAKQRLTQQHQQAQQQQQAKQEQDDQAWQYARQKNTMAAYQAYLDGPTDHKHADEAKQRLTQLHQQAQEQQAKQEQDDNAWQTAHQKNTIAAYQAYLDGQTLKKHTDEAKQRLTQLHQQAQQQAKQEQDDQAWQTALQKNTISAYQAYLEGQTLKKHTDEAKQRLTQQHQQAQEKRAQEKIRRQQAAQQLYNTQAANSSTEEDPLLVEQAKEAETEDQQAWQQACQQDTQTAYQAYINGLTNKTHTKEAEKRLIKLVEDETAWQRTRQKDNQFAYQAYLDGRTLKKHAQDAEQRLITLTEEDNKAWQQACQQNTQFAYQAYLDGHTLKNYAQEAKQQLIAKTQEAEDDDENAWQLAQQQNTPVAYQAYLDGPTIKIHAEEAEQQLVDKTQESEEDEQAWLNAEQEDTIEAYQDYLYGQTLKRYAKEAKQRLREKAKETEDEKAWQIALQQDTQQAYQTYLYGQTVKIYGQEARQRLMEKTKEAEEQDEQAWQQALEQDTQTAYQAYLEGPTLKKHLHEAKQRLIEQAQTAEDEQAWQQALQQDTLSAYQAYLEGQMIKNHVEEAKQRLLEKTKDIEQDEKAWQLAEQKNTQAAYQAYLDGQTLKRHAEEAQQQLTDKIKEVEQDEKAWQQALQEDTQTAYQAYLDGLTIKTHTDEAQQRLKAFVHKTFKFKTTTVNAKGETTQSRPKQAIYDIKDLGNNITLEMVYIPGGSFLMGAPINEQGSSNDEYPQHPVSIKPFWMSKFPITQAQWQAMMGKNPSTFQGANRPVEQVSWHDAINFCQRLSEKTGQKYELPSEAQWEYACRAGTTTPFHFGQTITTQLANYDGNETYASEAKGVYRQQTTEVGRFSPNAFGLYDMHGNIGEWCADLWHDNYQNAPTDGSVWEKGGENALRLIRGGSWNDTPDDCRSAYRSWYTSTSKNDLVSFRVIAMDWG